MKEPAKKCREPVPASPPRPGAGADSAGRKDSGIGSGDAEVLVSWLLEGNRPVLKGLIKSQTMLGGP